MQYTDRFKATPLPDANLSGLPSQAGAVETPSNAYEQMQGDWAVIEAVRAGTSGVRDQGKAYLPSEPFEKPGAYDRRCARSCFAPWYQRLVRGLVGMVLRKPIILEAVSEDIAAQLDNVNLLGYDLQAFSKEVFEAAIDYGYTGVFVDYPNAAGVTTLAEQSQRGDRPYWIHYTAPEIIGWRFDIVANRRVFNQLRIRQTALEPVGEFGEEQIEKILVYDMDYSGGNGRCRFREFRKLKEKFEQVSESLLSLPFIPFVFVSTNTSKSMVVRPPMLEVAYLNIRHYQLSSDLDHALHIAAHPKLVLYGYSAEMGDVNVGADEALVFDSPDGRAEWISPQLGSFEAQERRMGQLEVAMATLGLSTLVGTKNAAESAEAKKLDRVQGDSIMATIAQSLQDALDLCLEYHAYYLGETAGTCQVNRDFDLSELTPQAVDSFSKLHSQGQISLKTLLALLKRGEVFPDEFDIDEEIRRLEANRQKQSETILPPELDATAADLPASQSRNPEANITTG